MKARHVVTLIVVLVAAALLTGIFLRLRATDTEEDGGGEDTSAATDSIIQTTAAATAFATGVSVPVAGAPVRRDTFVIWVKASGRAQAVREATLLAEVNGPIISVPAREGSFVRAGALLAEIDPTDYELDLADAKGALERAQAEYQDLTLGDERIEDPELRAERQRLARVRSGLTAAETEVERARRNLDRTRVRAPFAGQVADVAVVPGTRVRQNSDTIATIVELSRLEVDVNVLESEVASIEVGREAEVRFAAFPSEVFAGRVVTINPVVDEESHTTRVTIRLDNPAGRILPGMYAEVRIAGRLYEDRTFVPRDAIVERDRRDVVFVFEPEKEGSDTGRAKWRYVTTGLENDRFVEIVPSEDTEMVTEGEIVLVEGHTTLAHDALVKVEMGEATGAGS
jgi:membrane fusion protein (multidrug efflux system)